MDASKKRKLQNLMSQSWFFVKNNNFTMAEAMKVAWLNAKLKVQMKKRIVKFYFKKADGSVREAYGTLIDTMCPPVDESRRKTNDALQVYYDTEKQSYRSFKRANLLSIA